MNGIVTMATLWRDAVRGLRIGSGTTALAFVILTLAMTAGTVTFSVVDNVVLRPLPFSDPDRLVGISSPSIVAGTRALVSPQDYFAWKEGTEALESVAASRPSGSLRLELDGVAETVTATTVTTNLFDVLGVKPEVGGFFDAGHELPGGPSVVVLSHDLWRRRFGANPNVVGRQIRLGQQVREVLGVVPAGVWYPVTAASPSDVYLPYLVTTAERSNGRAFVLSVVARVRPGVAIEQARADLGRLGSAIVLPLHEQVVGPAGRWLLFVLAAVGLVIFLGCVNVASLLLARATTRLPELATREAIGASRYHLSAALLLEGLLLALTSAAAALLLSQWGVKLLAGSLPPGALTRVTAITVDARVMAVCIAAALLSALVFSSAPAWLATRTDLIGIMRSGAPTTSNRRYRALSGFVVAQITVVCVLLVATALVVTSFILVTTADLGFDRRNLMTVTYQRQLDGTLEADRPNINRTIRDELLRRVRAVPGVTGAAIATNSSAPLQGSFSRYSLTIPGIGEVKGADAFETRFVTPDYFSVMGMELLEGRLIGSGDRSGAQAVMLINDVAARKFFPNGDAISQVVTFRGPTAIVGILRGVHFDGPEADTRAEMYFPVDQEGPMNRLRVALGHLVVRTTGDPRRTAAAVTEAISPALGSAVVSEPRYIDDAFRRITATRRFNAGVMATFGTVAFLIGAIGIYAMMAFLVAQQTRSIGIRMALGASASDVLKSVLNDAVLHVIPGVTVGLGCAWATSSLLRSLVFRVDPTHPAVYLAVAALLILAGLGAALMPALRASRLDPLTTLRVE
jgi:predicted permease